MNEYRFETDTNEITLTQLQHLVDTIPGILNSIPEDEFSRKPSPDKWSKKEIIGHLIDSATNNHHRFVRAQFDENPIILYNQVLWNNHSYYQQMDGHHLISFWALYNQHIIELIKRIPPESMEKGCRMSDGEIYTLSWLFDDYVRHLEHHLRQIPDLNI
ncbi:MAG TPA: DinB family protein [Saprospiraceae bacterium]|nr:DinB family protein [Saprospiraceae bacterium]